MQVIHNQFFLFISILIISCVTSIHGQTHVNVSLLSQTSMGEGSSDVWGYVDSNDLEYAIIGTVNSTRIYSLENAASPMLRITMPGVNTTWRDMKSYGQHIYGVTDVNGMDGLLVVNMTGAPDTITHYFWQPVLTVGPDTGPLEQSHNIYIDEAGYAYLAGGNLGVGGIIILDLFTNPDTPTYVGNSDNFYCHDVYVRDTFMYTSDIFNGHFAVYSISDRTNPQLITTQSTGRTFTHNAWLSDDGNVLYTTDEKSNAYTEAYDISDLNNISRIDRFRPLATEGLNVIPHNVHVHNDFLVISHYTDGVVIVDAAQPDNLIEVGNYDTWLGGNGGFSGCWGAYPFLPSGLLLASDRNTGLYVLQPTYNRACYLRGTVRDVNTNAVIPNVDIQILSPILNQGQTDNFGNYATGIREPGVYDVVYSHPSYSDDTMQVQLEQGMTTIEDIFLGSYVGPCPPELILSDNFSSQAYFAEGHISISGFIEFDVIVELHADSVTVDSFFQMQTGGQLRIFNEGCE